MWNRIFREHRAGPADMLFRRPADSLRIDLDPRLILTESIPWPPPLAAPHPFALVNSAI